VVRQLLQRQQPSQDGRWPDRSVAATCGSHLSGGDPRTAPTGFARRRVSPQHHSATETQQWAGILDSTLLYSTLLTFTLLCSALLYSTLLYFTLLYSTLLFSNPLYSTLLYSTLLYSTLLYSTPLSTLHTPVGFNLVAVLRMRLGNEALSRRWGLGVE
jgi:hypothetical protein